LISIDYHDDLKEVQADAQLAALLAAPAADAPFDRLEWWQGLVEECDIFPFIAVARDGDSRAVLGMYRVKRQIVALANWYSFRIKPIVSPGADADRLLDALARDLTGEAPHIMLAPLPDEQGETTRLAAAFRRAGWLVFREQCDVNHVLRVQGRSYAEFLDGRPGQVRTTLKRKAAKVSVAIETVFNPDSWLAYEAIYAKSWKPEEGSPAFLRRFAEAEGAAGRLRLGIARADGEPVAAQFWTVEAGTAFIHKLAHTEASKPLSPGTTLSAALFAHVIDHDRVELVDFGTGNDGYKRDWMEEVRPRYRLEMLRPGWPGNWPTIARLMLRSLAGRAKRG
jgi:CelD/BcsL family acetyltransferase involved in cellulose biosynthesis